MGGIFLIQTDGKLVEMKEYGLQFKATALKTVPPSSRLYFKPKIILTVVVAQNVAQKRASVSR